MDVAAARGRLEEILIDLERSLATLGAENLPEADGAGWTTRTADPGSALSDADREDALIETIARQQQEVRAALGRIDAGTYGRCVDCGAELPEERLEARPEAARCVKDQARLENAR